MSRASLIRYLVFARHFRSSSNNYLRDITSRTPSISANNVKEYLAECKLPFSNGHSSYIVSPCPLCSIKDKDTTLFVNKTTGSSVCSTCKFTGPWKDVSQLIKKQRYQKNKVIVNKNNFKPQKASKTPCDLFWNEKCIPWNKTSADIKQKAIETFQIQKLKSSLMEKYGLRFTNAKFPQATGEAQELTCVVFPWYLYSNKNEVSSPDRVKLETLLPSKQRLTSFEPKEGPLGLFGWNTIPKEATTLVITGDEFDAIAVHQCTGLPAVSLPLGASALPPEILPQLEHFNKIYLWLGSDAHCRQSAAQFARKLNVKRCFIIGPPSEKQLFSSALDALNQSHNLKDIVSSAIPASHKQIMTFQQLREEVFSELLNADQVAGVKWQRFPELAKHLKGFRPGELTVFTGPTGSGKTTLMSELSLDLCNQGVPTLWGSFEIRNVRLAKVMLKQFSGINLDKHLQQYEYWADRFQQIPLYYMGFHGPVEISTVIETMAHAAYVYDIQHVIIDNLQFMIGAKYRGFDDTFYAQNFAISQFRNFASSKNVHVSVIMHPRKEDEDKPLQTSSIFGTAKASQEADNVLILQAQPRREKFLQITKNRFSGDVGKVALQFNKDSLTMSGHVTSVQSLQPQKNIIQPIKTVKKQSNRSSFKSKDLKPVPLKNQSKASLSVGQSKTVKIISDECFPPCE